MTEMEAPRGHMLACFKRSVVTTHVLILTYGSTLPGRNT